MTFTYAGQDMRIVFYHRHEPYESWPQRCIPICSAEVQREGALFVRAVTHCYIERKYDGKWRTTDRLVGIAHCSLSDNFSKEHGRKLSLGRCLRICDDRFKEAAWSAYLNRK